MTKTRIHFFTVADYLEEEVWLREQHKAGWRLIKMTLPCFYLFEQCAPEDVVYRLDYRNFDETSDYIQLCRDFGWEYFAKCAGWLYFRKSASTADTENSGELFSDDESRLDMIRYIIRTRILPLLILFFCCIIPNLFRFLNGSGASVHNLVLGAIFTLLFFLYVFLLVYCGTKLRRSKETFSGKKKR